MKRILAILAALVLVPSLCTAALLDPCTECMGSSTATSGEVVTFTDASNWATYYADLTGAGYTVVPTFKWNLYMLSGEDDGTCTYSNIGSYLNLKKPDGTPLTLPYGGEGITGTDTFAFRAPIDPGCYQVYLTMYVKVTSPGGITNVKACTDDACWILCVSPANCPSCSDMFCEIDCGDFPTTAAVCPSWDVTDLPGLCYLGDKTGLVATQVKWHLLSAIDITPDPTCVITPNEVAVAGDLDTYMAGIPDVWNEAFCFDSKLCDSASCDLPDLTSGSGRYTIIMSVWDIDSESGAQSLVSYCPAVGTLTEVDDPTASISSP